MTQPTPPDGPGPRRPATLADWEAVPPPYTAHLIGGRLHVHPKPMPQHSRAQGRLLTKLDDPFDQGLGGPGGWILLQEVDVKLGQEIVAPDIAGWRRDRMPSVPRSRPIALAPDWVCEVISPRTETFDRGDKANWYQEAGVGWLWFADPEAQTLEVYENDGGQFRQRLRFQGSASVAAPPFDAVAWPLASLWG